MKHDHLTKLYEMLVTHKKADSNFTAIDMIRLFSDVKTGKRNNADDQKRIQTIHDMTNEMGVRCGEANAKSGARFSKEDKVMVETLHDHAVNLGADCGSFSITPVNDTSIGLKYMECPSCSHKSTPEDGYVAICPKCDTKMSVKVAAREDVKPETGKNKYGDVAFADEKNKKYPIDTADHIRAAWNYINKKKNAGKYSAEDLQTIKNKIIAAWKKEIDEAGPISAKKSDSLEEQVNDIRMEFNDEFQISGTWSEKNPYCIDVLDDSVIARFGDNKYQIPYTIDADGEVDFEEDMTKWTKVEKTWQPVKSTSIQKLCSDLRSAWYDWWNEPDTVSDNQDYPDEMRSSRPYDNGFVWCPYVSDVLDDAIVVQSKGKNFKIPYTVNGVNDYSFASPDQWVQVTESWADVGEDGTIKAKLNPDGSLKTDLMVCAFGTEVKAMNDEHLGGKCVVFSDKDNLDSTGDYFDKETDYGKNVKVGMTGPIYLHHTFPIATSKGLKTFTEEIGEATIKSIDDDGIEVDAVLYDALVKSHDLFKAKLMKTLKKAVKAGKMGWSTGTASHLVIREKMGNGWHIKRWPLGLDFTITPTAAGIMQGVNVAIKSVQTGILDLEDESPESGNAGATDSSTNNNDPHVKTDKGETMTPEEIQKKIDEGIKSGLAAQKAADEAEKAQQKKFDEGIQSGVKATLEGMGFKVEAKNGGGFAVNRNLKTGTGDTPEKAFNHWVKFGDAGGIRTGEAYNEFMREKGVNAEIKADYPDLESTQYQGSEAVPTEVAKKIFEKRDASSWVRLAGATVIPCSSKAITLPIESQGAQPVAPATIDASTNFKTEEIQKMDSVAGVVYLFPAVSIIGLDLLDDATFDVEAWEGRRVGRRMAVTEKKYFGVGTGSGEPQGLTYGGSKGASAASLTVATAGDLNDLYASIDAEYRDKLAWFLTGTTEGLYRKLQGSPFIYSNFGNPGGMGQQGQLGGTGTIIDPSSKVFNISDMAAIGASAKTVVLANVEAGYTIIERKLLTAIRDPFTLSRKGALQITWYWRNSGYVTNSAAVKYLQCPAS